VAALSSSKGDVMRAVTSFFESGGKMAEDIAEEELSRVRAQWAYWREFCKRNVAVTSVLDFPFADAVVPWGLNLSGDKRLLERIYCFGTVRMTRIACAG
jgi:hypothetical protein